MNVRRLAIVVTVFALFSGRASILQAQDIDDGPAITVRVHATFVDNTGGAGVLSGDMSIVRFEVRKGAVTAMTRMVGALADSAGNVLGHVDEEIAVPVGNIDSTCNQLQMDLDAVDADVLGAHVHFDRGAAGFDSRQGTTPKALGELCAVGELLRGASTATARVKVLNDVATAIKTPNARSAR